MHTRQARAAALLLLRLAREVEVAQLDGRDGALVRAQDVVRLDVAVRDACTIQSSDCFVRTHFLSLETRVMSACVCQLLILVVCLSVTHPSHARS